MGNWIPWFWPMGLPKTCRSAAWRTPSPRTSARVADALSGDQDALGVHAVEDVAEALAFDADQVARRHLEIVEIELGGGVIHHRGERLDGEAATDGGTQVDEQHGQTIGRFRPAVARRRAHEQ